MKLIQLDRPGSDLLTCTIRKKWETVMATLLLTHSLQNMKTHTAKHNTKMQDSEHPTLRDMNIYTVICIDIFLKNLLLQNDAASKQQWRQKHSNKLTFQVFKPALILRVANPNNSVLRTYFNHSLKQRTNTPISHAVHSPVTCFHKNLAYSKITKIVSLLLNPIWPQNKSLGNCMSSTDDTCHHKIFLTTGMQL